MARIRGLDHLGVAVQNVDEVADILCTVLGADRGNAEELDSEGLRVVSIHAGGTTIELFEPRADNSVRRFLDKRGNAIHHLCLRVDDLEAKLAGLAAAGIELIDAAPRSGAYGKRVAFIHPRATGGILIELSQETTS